MKSVLILGASGMLGSMVADVLSNSRNIKVIASVRDNRGIRLNRKAEYIRLNIQSDITSQLGVIFNLHPTIDYVINCIGVIKPYCNNEVPEDRLLALKINSIFPYELSFYIRKYFPRVKIISIATDCVFSGLYGKYTENSPHDPEDVYGKSKSLGEVITENTLNVRCSIIGPEIRNKISLLEWFLAKPLGSIINGYEHHLWNGITTLQYANFCKETIIHDSFFDLRAKNHTLHYVNNEDISKFELLNIFNSVFDRSVVIEKTNSIGKPIDRTLRSEYLITEVIPMRNAIEELRDHISRSQIYKDDA